MASRPSLADDRVSLRKAAGGHDGMNGILQLSVLADDDDDGR